MVSKYRFKVFRNPRMQKVVADAFREVELQFGIKIKEFAFGDDYAHIHIVVNVPANLSMQQARDRF
ncbi:transposase [Candidatus Marsarchaeota archaeon]|nr:transposase [Candidatus Marsarchaeota archaeon]